MRLDFVANNLSKQVPFHLGIDCCSKKSSKMLQLGANVPQNGIVEPMCKRQRTCGIAVAIPQISARTTNVIPNKFKTQLCARFRLGCCSYGNKCLFAHGIGEMRKPFPGPAIDDVGYWNENCRKGKQLNICRKFYMGKQCAYGDKCRFLHVNRETSGYGSSKPWVKRRLCNRWKSTGSCPFGNVCLFAHGQTELERPDCHVALVSGSMQSNTTWSLSMGKAAIWTTRNQQVQGRKFISKLKTIQKFAGIYADWIEDKPFPN